MAKWTKGPWRIEPEYGQPVILSGDEDVRRIATVDTDHFAEEVAEANARLIAAAPELYEALVGMLARFDLGEHFPGDHPIIAARAALKSALGDAP